MPFLKALQSISRCQAGLTLPGTKPPLPLSQTAGEALAPFTYTPCIACLPDNSPTKSMSHLCCPSCFLPAFFSPCGSVPSFPVPLTHRERRVHLSDGLLPGCSCARRPLSQSCGAYVLINPFLAGIVAVWSRDPWLKQTGHNRSFLYRQCRP